MGVKYQVLKVGGVLRVLRHAEFSQFSYFIESGKERDLLRIANGAARGFAIIAFSQIIYLAGFNAYRN